MTEHRILTNEPAGADAFIGAKDLPWRCWQCGKFRKAKDVHISRDWETGDWIDVVCSVCRGVS